VLDELAAHAVIERLWNIEWQDDISRIHSRFHIALMREYLRRSALWTSALNASDLSPWIDPARFVQLSGLDIDLCPGYVLLSSAPEYPGPGFDPLEDRILSLWQHLCVKQVGWLMRQTALWAIRWASLQRHPALQRFGLPDLYEPLLTLYEHGGHLRTEHGSVDFGYLMIRVESAQKRLQAPALASLVLTDIDALDGI